MIYISSPISSSIHCDAKGCLGWSNGLSVADSPPKPLCEVVIRLLYQALVLVVECLDLV